MAAGRRTVAGFWRNAAVRSSGHSVGDPYGRGLLVFYGFSLWHLGVGDRYRGENLVGVRDLRWACGGGGAPRRRRGQRILHREEGGKAEVHRRERDNLPSRRRGRRENRWIG